MAKAFDTSGRVLFEETQRFPKRLLFLIIGITGLTIGGLLLLYFTTEGNERAEILIGIAIAAPLELVMIYCFFQARLYITVTTNGLYYRWGPFQSRYNFIEKDKIESAEIRRTPIFNYGYGWFPGRGRLHNASTGTGQGIQLHLRNGDKVFFSAGDKLLFHRSLQQLISANPKTSLREF